MSNVYLVTKNILESATVTVSAGADTAYPSARLYDRAVSFYWQKTGTQAVTIHVDQGAAAILDVDFLAIYRHNLSGEDITWEYSDNNSDWSAAVTGWTQGDNNQIIKTLGAAANHRYWRVTITSIANPRIGEVWMGERLAVEVLAKPSPAGGYTKNVQTNRTIGGPTRSTKLGPSIRGYKYDAALSSAQLTAFLAALADLDELSLPFYFTDHRSATYPARFSEDPAYNFSNPTHVWSGFAVREEL